MNWLPTSLAASPGLAHVSTSFRRMAPKNFVALCDSCHRRIEALERSGRQTAHLFPRSVSDTAVFDIA
jgi:hypothetical protein